MEGQKMSIPGDQIGVPGATDKVSFLEIFSKTDKGHIR